MVNDLRMLHPMDISGFNLDLFQESVSGIAIPDTGVLEHTCDVRRFVNSTMLSHLGQTCHHISKVHLCEFSTIQLHIDVIPDGIRYAHLVLHGEFTMFIGEHEVFAKPGTFFEMNPRRPHSVYAADRIITLCLELLGE